MGNLIVIPKPITLRNKSNDKWHISCTDCGMLLAEAKHIENLPESATCRKCDYDRAIERQEKEHYEAQQEKIDEHYNEFNEE